MLLNHCLLNGSLPIIVCNITKKPMKAFIFALSCLFTSLAYSQKVHPRFSDPHLQYISDTKTTTSKDLACPVHNHIEIFNKNYDTLFIIDKYGQHIFEMKSNTKRHALIDIETNTWRNGSYEIIAIKNELAFHQKIVKI